MAQEPIVLWCLYIQQYALLGIQEDERESAHHGKEMHLRTIKSCSADRSTDPLLPALSTSALLGCGRAACAYSSSV
ncbi:hypothetical protein A4R35_19410 [Thermogemmatispora tikiterensis]|uniref:Uncharacterized protein n=1 Tax=Thermogemmatispora tikiterensis TaxID=1825093 RepID=A0A328VJ63_9CHLR|nr:hypothetical protein A4R35_19410 [Thermogemmatispora tikiterensis]